MLKYVFTLALFILLISCNNDSVTLVKEPGVLTGTVLPVGINASVHLIQGNEDLSSSVDVSGLFRIENVVPGVYTFIAKAKNYGSFKKENIKIESGEGYEIGTIELDTIPYPLYGISDIQQGKGRTNISDTYFTISFKKLMNLSSIRNSVVINPDITNLEIETYSEINSTRSYYYFRGDFEKGTTYTIVLDTLIETYWGEKLEFPFTKMIEYSESPFFITGIDIDDIKGSNPHFYILFNSAIQIGFEKFISINPHIELRMSTSGSRLYLQPVNSWRPDTEYSLTINKDLTDYDGNSLGKDSTISFTTEPFKVDQTYPLNNQIVLNDISVISIRFNYMFDPESLNFDSIVITPEINYTISYVSSFIRPEVFINSEEFQDSTEYSVEINPNLKDYWGGNLSEPYTFTFRTKM